MKKGKKKKKVHKSNKSKSHKTRRYNPEKELKEFLSNCASNMSVEGIGTIIGEVKSLDSLEYCSMYDLIDCGLNEKDARFLMNALLKRDTSTSGIEKEKRVEIREKVKGMSPKAKSVALQKDNKEAMNNILSSLPSDEDWEHTKERVNQIAHYAIRVRSESNRLPTISHLSSLEALLTYERYLLAVVSKIRLISSIHDKKESSDKKHQKKLLEQPLPPTELINELYDAIDNVNDGMQLLHGHLSRELKLPTINPEVPITRAENQKNCAWTKTHSTHYKPKKIKNRRHTTGKSDKKHKSLHLHEFTSKEIAAMYEKRIRILGEGTFGIAVETIHSGRKVALKLMKERVDLDELLTEIRALQSAGGNKNVIEYVGCCQDCRESILGNDYEYAIVTELLGLPNEPLGIPIEFDTIADMKGVLESDDIILTPYDRIKIALDAAKGLRWLHNGFKPGIVHRDIAAKNIFVTWTPEEGYVAKMGDLGLSRKINRNGFNLEDTERAQRPQGTPLTMAPEVMKYHAHNTKADVFSFGMVLWRIWTGQDLETAELVSSLRKINPGDIFGAYVTAITELGFRPTIPAGTPRKLKKLIKRCWDTQPSNRLPMRDVVQILQELLIEVAIPEDIDAQQFWKSAFDHKEEVSWDTFIRRFLPLMGIKPKPRAKIPLVYVKVVLGEEKESSSSSSSSSSSNNTNSKNKHRNTSIKRNSQELNVGWKMLREDSNKAHWNIEGNNTRKVNSLRNKKTSSNSKSSSIKTKKLVFEDDSGSISSTHNRTVPTLDNEQLSLLCLQALCAEERSEGNYNVTTRSFGNMIAWFGPLKPRDHGKGYFLKHIRKLLCQPWYHIRKDNNILLEKPAGTFLVRKSSTRGAFVVGVSRGEGKTPLSLRLNALPQLGTYTLDNSIVFQSVSKAVKFLQMNGPRMRPTPIIMTTVCSGFMFEDVLSRYSEEEEESPFSSEYTSSE